MESRPPFRVGPWRADPALDLISQGDSSVKLVPKTMDVLCHLAQRAGEVVSQEEIEHTVWRQVVVTPSSVYQAIADLRRALGDDKHRPTYIATVPRKGYRLIAPVVWGEREVAEPARRIEQPADESRAPVVAPATAAAGRTAPRWLTARAIAGIVALVAGVAVLGIVVARRFETGPVGPTTDPRSIAVLPVADFSEEGNQGHFADGLTEEMLNTLAQIPQLRVTARTSVFVFKNRNEDVRAIGRALGTRYVLEGSVRRSAERVRVTAQLVDTSNGYHVWSKTYDRPMGDVLQVQEDIARSVAASLQVTLSSESLARIAARRSVNVDAYELYLLGRHYQLQRSPDAIAKAVDYQQQAIASDPGFALAYAGLADARMGTYYYSNQPFNEVRKSIEPLLEKGLELNSNLPELYAARALLHTQEFDLAHAEQDLKRAIELNPNYAEAYVRLGATYEYDGRPREALASFARAAELDPLHFILHTRRCLALQNLGRYDEATSACNRAIELDPGAPNAYWARGLIALSAGRYEAAIQGYREALERAPQRVDLLGQLGWLYLDIGLPRQAESTFGRALAVSGPGPNYAYLSSARSFVAAGDNAGLRKQLSLDSLAGPAEADMLLDIAVLEIVSGAAADARHYCERATHASDFDYQRLFDVWNTRWGTSDVLTLAECARAAGNEAEAKRYLADLSAYLDRLERNGQLWHGLRYLRADVLAMQGKPDEAMNELQAATRLGWHRVWWPRSDPALATLRGTPRFDHWLNSLEATNKEVQPRVLSAEAPRRLHAAVVGYP